MKIVVVDYEVGNISSIINMLKKIGVEAVHSRDIEEIQKADKLILPGVGAFDHGMKSLQDSGLIEPLHEEVLIKKKPLLGICLGMQLLLNESAEGKLKGLGWIQGRCVRFNFENKTFRVPHMGWNVVKQNKNSLCLNQEDESRYYFVHSYHAVCSDEQDVLATACHGYHFPAIIGRNHILGAQFHPEKSHKYGMQFLQSFIEREYA